VFRISPPSGNGSYRVRPSKPIALISIPFGIAMIVFVIVSMTGGKHHVNYGFLAIWIALVICIIAYNLWAAFSKRGYLYRLDRDR
jgi:hypothetical protein